MSAVLCGCTQYAHRSMHNAPGIVDLETPIHEAGDPSAYTLPAQPGVETIAVFVTPSVLFGIGRYGSGLFNVEPGVAFRFERLVDSGAAYLKPRAFAITVGTGLVSLTEHRPTLPAAVFAQLDYRFLAKVIPVGVGLGPVLYPGADRFTTDVGAQLDVKITILQIRARYMPQTGFEIMAGYSIPIPLFFRRSR